MPGFRRVSREETSSRRPAVNPALARLKQYQGYIKKVTAGETGRLSPGKGETPAAVRRRLGAAASARAASTHALAPNREGRQTRLSARRNATMENRDPFR